MEIAKTTKTIDDSIESLKNSPIFAMSLSSKELFHSNFWTWLMEQDSEFIKCFFPSDDLSGENGIRILREKEHMDIQIQIGRGRAIRKYVIENKFKSIPTENQLREYAGAEGFEKGVLTGISKEPPFKLPENWTYLSYDSYDPYDCICTRLENQLDNTKNDNLKENKDIVTQYIEMTRNLVSLIKAFLYGYGERWLFPDIIPEEIKNLRIDDVIQKMQAEKFLHYFRKNSRYKRDLFVEKDGYTLIVGTDMRHATSLFDVLYKESREGKEIGIQIQNKEFRWFVNAEDNRNLGEVFGDERYDSWFDREFVARSGTISTPKLTNLGKKLTSLGGKGNVYRKFAPNFICQYFTLSEDELEFQKLVELIDLFLDAASEVIRAPGR